MAPFQWYLLMNGISMKNIILIAVIGSMVACTDSAQELPPDSTPLTEVDSSLSPLFCNFAADADAQSARDLGILGVSEPLYPDGETSRQLNCPEGYDVRTVILNSCGDDAIEFPRTNCSATVGDWKECMLERASTMCTYDGGPFGDPWESCLHLAELCPGI